MAVTQTTNVSQRRVVYGANVLVQIIVVTLIAVGVIYASTDRGQVDLTRTGANSLSPKTVGLLRGLEENVTITAVYTVLSEYDERAQKRQNTVDDLLKLYESAGRGRITARMVDPMKDRAQLPALLKRLREKPAYRDEAAKHEEALNAFPEINQQLMTLVDQQLTRIEQLFAADPALQQSQLVEIAQELNRLKQRSELVNGDVQKLLAADLPQYGKAVEAVRGYLETAQNWIQAVKNWVEGRTAADVGLSESAFSFVQGVSNEYQAMKGEIDDLLSQTADLERLKLEELSDELNRWANSPPIIVETDREAEVVPFFEVWPMRQDMMAATDGDDREFAGEQSISSTILKLTQKEKTAVIFTRFGGPSPITPDFSQFNPMQRRMPRAPFGVLNELLGDENFVTQDWDVSTQKEPPTVEDAARTVYVIFPPAPPPQTDPRRPPPTPAISQDDIQVITDAIESAGKAIFLVRCSLREVGGSGSYEFADYLRTTWGIDAAHTNLILRFAPSPENSDLYVPRRPPLVIDTSDRNARAQMTGHAITEPLLASNAGFMAACPLDMVTGDDAPSDATVSELAVVEPSTDIWAIDSVFEIENELRTQRGTTRKPANRVPPFNIALAGEKEDQRIVVFGSVEAFADAMIEQPGGFAFTGGGLVAYPAYPANPDLFINAVHWLTNEADRISVGARRTEVPRLDKLEEGFWMDFWRIFLVGIWPGFALIVGGGVWFFRRR